MIYLDNAATTLKKPPGVYRAVNDAMRQTAGYARGDHRAAMRAGEMVFNCREEIAQMFGVENPSQVIFTLNATHALNIAINAMATRETPVAVTGYEHNAVMRPLVQRGITPMVLSAPLWDDDALLQRVDEALNRGIKLFILCHVSNVFGAQIPLEEIAKRLQEGGARLILDASQSAGVLDIDCKSMPAIAAVCMPGHKALYGPQGTGVLLCLDETIAKTPFMTGGTGSLSAEMQQPDFLPDAHESGTPNVPGIAGLLEGVRFVRRITTHDIRKWEHTLISHWSSRVKDLGELTLFRGENQTGVISFCAADLPSEVFSSYLTKRGIATRCGLHCAPLAHRSAGTEEYGTVRISVSAFTTRNEMERCAEIVRAVVNTSKKG